MSLNQKPHIDPLWNADELRFYVRLVKRLEVLLRTDLWFYFWGLDGRWKNLTGRNPCLTQVWDSQNGGDPREWGGTASERDR